MFSLLTLPLFGSDIGTIKSKDLSTKQLMDYLSIKGFNYEFKFEEDVYINIRYINDKGEVKNNWSKEKAKEYLFSFILDENFKTIKLTKNKTLSFNRLNWKYTQIRHKNYTEEQTKVTETSSSTSGKTYQFAIPKNIKSSSYSFMISEIELDKPWNMFTIYDVNEKILFQYSIIFSKNKPVYKKDRK